jgi:hypothetical protein
MGWFRKTPTADDIAAQGKAILEVCVEAFKRTWIELNPKAPTPEMLAVQIEEFVVFAAVLESKTHTTDQVNKAIDLLRKKYAS